jgi:hypothetical protein
VVPANDGFAKAKAVENKQELLVVYAQKLVKPDPKEAPSPQSGPHSGRRDCGGEGTPPCGAADFEGSSDLGRIAVRGASNPKAKPDHIIARVT